MSNQPAVRAFDLLPRDTLCQGTEILRLKWRPRTMLGPPVDRSHFKPSPLGLLPREQRLWREELARTWQEWLAQPSSGALARHVIAVTGAAAQGKSREVEALDADFGRSLGTDAAMASRRGGAALLLACEGLLHARVLAKLRRDWVDWEGDPRAGAESWHWATVWGALMAMFSMPPAAAALVALFAEWEALDPLDRRGRPTGEAVAEFARESAAGLADCAWIGERMREAFPRIA